MGWSSLRAKIKAKLDALSPATLGTVFDGARNPQNLEVPLYPAVEIIRGGTNPDYFTNRQDMQTYIFTLHFYKPLTGDDWHTQELAMDSIIDTVMQAFLDDPNLTGTADGRMLPIENSADVISWNGKMHRRDTIILRCRQITTMA